jgi:methylated-DNA-protein-cysteine methyltransferase related protein
MKPENKRIPPQKDSSPDHQPGEKSFFKGVYQIVQKIPPGKVLTYGQIATMLGAPYMARQVGWAMHGCPKGLPWQRVVGAGGRILINSLSLGGGPLLQRKLLEMEGVQFLGSRVDLNLHQYRPARKKTSVMGKKR